MPEVVAPEVAGVAAPEPDAGAAAEDPPLLASPSTATEFPVAVTGTAADTGTCAPEPTPSVPEVVKPDADGADAVDAGADDPVPLASPSTATEFPVAVTGAAADTGACAPEPTPSEPEVVAGAGAGDAGVAPLFASPATLAALPDTVTGTETLTSAWSPPATDPTPLVVAVGAGAAAAGAEDVPEVVESPSTAIPFPETSTGAATATAA